MLNVTLKAYKSTVQMMTATAVLLAVMLQPVYAAEDSEDPFYDSYQLALLYNPTQADLEIEQQGRVNIYIGLTDKQVEQAMDTQYERIDSMMFASVIVTDETGETLKDPETGAVLVEEDGCD